MKDGRIRAPGKRGFPITFITYNRDRAQAFDSVVAHYPTSPLHVVIDGVPQAVLGSVVTASYFEVLNIRPRRGRLLTTAEDTVRDRDAVHRGQPSILATSSRG